MPDLMPMAVPTMPLGITPVELKRRKDELPITCGGCNQPFRPKEVHNYHGRRLCRECLDLEERARKTDSLLIVVKEIMARKIDAAGRQGANEGAIELNTSRKAFLQEIGGETTFGTMWAQLVKRTRCGTIVE